MEARDIYYDTYIKVKGQHKHMRRIITWQPICNLYNLLIKNQLSYLPVLHWIHGLGELVANYVAIVHASSHPTCQLAACLPGGS